MDLSGPRGASQLLHEEDVRWTSRLFVWAHDDGVGPTDHDWPVELAWRSNLHRTCASACDHRRVPATGASRRPEEMALY